MKFIILFLMFISVRSFAESNGFFTIDESQYKTNPTSLLEVTNMPPVRSQDSIGICYAFTAAAAIDAANCKIAQKDCSKITNKEKASVLDLARYSTETADTDSSSKASAPLSGGIAEGGDPTLALYNAAFENGAFIRESCAPFDQIISKIASPSQTLELQAQAWERLKLTYSQYKKKYEECKQCAADYAATATEKIKQDFNLQRSNDEILKAFAAGSYSEFLDSLLIPSKCKGSARELTNLSGRWEINLFPKKKKDKNYNAALGKIKDILKSKNPVIVNTYCAADDKPSNMAACKGRLHSFLITGYRKVCDSNNKCKEAIKIHNSWGQAWQDQNDNGWVDAKSVLDRTYYADNSLSWLQEKN